MSELSGQIALTVSDVDTALSFYRDILGLPFYFNPHRSWRFYKRTLPG